LGSCILTDDATAASTNVVIDNSNNFIEGPITQSGSVSLANLFGNVVANKGTFTPLVVGTTTAGATSGGTTSAEWTKLDNVVYFKLTISYTSTTGTGNIQVNGLPFANSSLGPAAVNIQANGLPITSGYSLAAVVTQSASTIAISQFNPSAGSLSSIALPSSMTELTITGSYPTS